LGLGAVGIEDSKVGDEVRVLAARKEQHAVAADPEMGVAEARDPGRGELPGKPIRLEDQVVVAEGLPLLESHRRSLTGINQAVEQAKRFRGGTVGEEMRSRPTRKVIGLLAAVAVAYGASALAPPVAGAAAAADGVCSPTGPDGCPAGGVGRPALTVRTEGAS